MKKNRFNACPECGTRMNCVCTSPLKETRLRVYRCVKCGSEIRTREIVIPYRKKDKNIANMENLYKDTRR